MEMFGSGAIAETSRPARVAIATAAVDAAIAAACCDLSVCSHWLLLIIALGRATRRRYLCVPHNPRPDKAAQEIRPTPLGMRIMRRSKSAIGASRHFMSTRSSNRARGDIDHQREQRGVEHERNDAVHGCR